MDEKKIRLMWGISLMVVSLCSFALSLGDLFSDEVHDVIKIVCLVLDLISLPLLAYSSVRLLKARKK